MAGMDECPLCAEDQSPPHVVLHADRDPEPGVWCPHCAVPSVVRFPLTARCIHGWPLGVGVAPVEQCQDCGRILGATHSA